MTIAALVGIGITVGLILAGLATWVGAFAAHVFWGIALNGWKAY